MENNDFRRRLLDQELPVDAGAFSRVMERRKAGGTGAAWIAKGIWAAALLIGTAGIGMYLQRSPLVANEAEKQQQAGISQDAQALANHTDGSADKSARYSGAAAMQHNQSPASASLEAHPNSTAASGTGKPGIAFPRPAGSLSKSGHHNTGTKTSFRNSAITGMGMETQNGLRTSVSGDYQAQLNSAANEPSAANSQAHADAWTTLIKQPLRIHPMLRKPHAIAPMDFSRTGRIAQNFLQTEWMIEPGWVLKQGSAGAALRRQERFAGAAAFTARAVFPSSSGFQWVSGIRYQEWVDHFNFSQEHTSTHQRIDAYDVIIRVPGQPDRTETRYDTTQMQVSRQESYADINRYRMIGLPLAFRWSPVPDGIWYVQAGITPSYLVYRGGSRRMNDGSVVSLADGANINRFQVHAGLSAGMRRFVAPRIAMLLEPGLGYNLTQFASGSMRQRNLQLSLSAGLMFHLGR